MKTLGTIVFHDTAPLLQEVRLPSRAVIEGGTALHDSLHVLTTSQIFRPGQPTQPGPVLTEATMASCSTTLEDGSVIMTGGFTLSSRGGSTRVQVFNFTTKEWTPRESMNQKRSKHSCGQVWLTPDDYRSNIFSDDLTNNSVLSIVVAGGLYFNSICFLNVFVLSQGCT